MNEPQRREPQQTTRPEQRFVLLGASNLTFSFPMIANTLATQCSGPVDLFAAHGHGRSIGSWSYVLVRGLPGILDSQLWNDLDQQITEDGEKQVPLHALITDLGNDLIYGSSVDQIMEWFIPCLERLAKHQADLVWVRPPLERVLKLSTMQYHVVKQLFFPGKAVPWETMQSAIQELDVRVERLIQRHGGLIVEPKLQWYGIDPIHIRSKWQVPAWESILNHWNLKSPLKMVRCPVRQQMKTWRYQPAEKTMLGRGFMAAQPVANIGERARLWLY